MRTLGNVIWIVFGGIFIAIEYVIASIGLMVTIIGIPFGLQSLKLARAKVNGKYRARFAALCAEVEARLNPGLKMARR